LHDENNGDGFTKICYFHHPRFPFVIPENLGHRLKALVIARSLIASLPPSLTALNLLRHHHNPAASLPENLLRHRPKPNASLPENLLRHHHNPAASLPENLLRHRPNPNASLPEPYCYPILHHRQNQLRHHPNPLLRHRSNPNPSSPDLIGRSLGITRSSRVMTWLAAGDDTVGVVGDE